MNIAYFGNDWHLGCIDVFMQQGHRITHIFTNGEMPFNQKIRQFAIENQIDVSCNKPQLDHIKQLQQQGVDCLFSIEYGWLIPVPDDEIFTMNVHPTLLPEGRGATPVSQLINGREDHSGITFHKLSDQFDKGDLIYQEAFSLAENESYETLMIKLSFWIPDMLNTVLNEFDDLYSKAAVQSPGSEWPKLSIEDRVIDWAMPVARIQQLARSCGRFGIVAYVAQDDTEKTLLVNYLEVSLFEHNRPIGSIIREDADTLVMAASDGFVIIFKRNILDSQ